MPMGEPQIPTFPVPKRGDTVEDAHVDLKHKRLIPTNVTSDELAETAEKYRKLAQKEVQDKFDAQGSMDPDGKETA